MTPSGRDEEVNERRTIGRKRPYEPADESNGSSVEEPSQSEAEVSGGTSSSSARWSNNLSDSSDVLGVARGAQSAQESDSSAFDAARGGESILNSSHLVSSSTSDANRNGSTTDTNSGAASSGENNHLLAPPPPQPAALNPLGFNQSVGVEQAFPPGLGANPAVQANLAAPGASAELLNLYQLNLLQLMNSQPTLLAQQGGPNPGFPPTMPPQQALNPFLVGNPYNRALYQQAALPSNMPPTDLQRQLAAGLVPGAASLPPTGIMGADAAALGFPRGITAALASLPGFRPTSYRQPVKATEGPVLYLTSDDEILSENQLLLRKQIELFAADENDVNAITPGRRKPITLGQVGIRCKYCTHIPIHHRTKGAVYYPSKLKGIYQAAQNMAASHLCDACDQIDPFLKAELRAYQAGKSTSGHGGKQYWADSAKVLGVMETEEEGLRFDPAWKFNKKTGKAERRR